MTSKEIEGICAELNNLYKGCRVKIADDKRELVAEISDGYAVAVIERSLPHFHLKMTENYRVLRGMLYIACGGIGYVLRKGETITIVPGQIHSARGADGPAWIEVESVPPWSPDDHFIL